MTHTSPLLYSAVADPRGGPGSEAMPPRHVGKCPECTKSRHFQTQNRNIFGKGQCPSPDLSTIGEGDTTSPNTTSLGRSAPRYSRLRRSATAPWAPRSSRLRRSTLASRLQIMDPPLSMRSFTYVLCAGGVDCCVVEVNWTATYRLDSTIVAPYERFTYFSNYSGHLPSTSAGRDVKAGKTRHVAWFASNCHAGNGRGAYVNELQKYIGQFGLLFTW